MFVTTMTAHSYKFFTLNNLPSNMKKKDFSFFQSQEKKISLVDPLYTLITILTYTLKPVFY